MLAAQVCDLNLASEGGAVPPARQRNNKILKAVGLDNGRLLISVRLKIGTVSSRRYI